MIEFTDTEVIKTLDDTEIKLDRQWNRTPEPDVLNSLPENTFTPEVLWERDGQFAIPRYGEAVGRHDGLSVKMESEELVRLIEWLRELGAWLQDHNFDHHDIHPGNIVRDQDSFRLIDWAWSQSELAPVSLNLYYSHTDYRSIELLCRQAVLMLISRVGVGDYMDGSSTLPGWTYHPIPFEPFAQLHHHKTACFEEIDTIRLALHGVEPGSMLDIGAGTGFFSFLFAEDGWKVTAIERDPANRNLMRGLKAWSTKTLKIADSIPLGLVDYDFDVILLLNTHMWLVKQKGRVPVKELMGHVARSCKMMFFQTAGAESEGMYTLSEFKGEEDIKEYLEECGFAEVERLKTISGHGGLRHLFRAKGKK